MRNTKSKPVLTQLYSGRWQVTDGITTGSSKDAEGAYQAYKDAKAESNAFSCLACKHTPAPWKTEEHAFGFYIMEKNAADWNPIVSTWANNKYATEANANLISAAPDILTKIKSLTKTLKNIHKLPQSFYNTIAKARGTL